MFVSIFEEIIYSFACLHRHDYALLRCSNTHLNRLLHVNYNALVPTEMSILRNVTPGCLYFNMAHWLYVNQFLQQNVFQ